jgi:hypothetical protein
MTSLNLLRFSPGLVDYLTVGETDTIDRKLYGQKLHS